MAVTNYGWIRRSNQIEGFPTPTHKVLDSGNASKPGSD